MALRNGHYSGNQTTCSRSSNQLRAAIDAQLQGTVKKYMRRARRGLPPVKRGHTWATFISIHVVELWACDFVQIYDVLFRTVFVYFIIELGSRRVVHYGVTRAPSDFWVTQQVREATPYEERPRFLIRDNDSKYGQCFTRVAEVRQLDVLRTPVRALKANGICERFIGSVRRECLGYMLIMRERHLHRVIGQRIPKPSEEVAGLLDQGNTLVWGF